MHTTQSGSTRRWWNPFGRLRVVASTVALAAVVVTAAGCAGGGTPNSSASVSSEPQIIAASVAFDPIDPHKTSNGITIALGWYVFESLFQAKVSDPTSFYPALAAGEAEKVDDTTYKVKIREGATFQDGSPVTADDVAASFNRVIGLGEVSVLEKYLVNFKSVVADSDDTVTFTLNNPTSIFEERTSTVRIIPASVAEGAEDSDALNYAPIGSGPYKVVSADPQTGAKLEAYEGYNGPLKGKFSTENIEFQVIPDSNARLSALQSGEVNLIGQAPYNALATLDEDDTYKTAAPDSLSTHIVFVNASAEPFDDVKVRQAFQYAVDKAQIADVAYEGYATVADLLVPESNADFSAPSIDYTRDVPKAKELLAEAGYPDGVSITLQVPTEQSAMTTAGQLLQTQLAEAGFTVELLPGDTGSLYENVNAGDFQAMYAGTSPALLGSADADFIYRWLYYGGFIRDYTFWTDPEMEKVESLLDQASFAPTREEYEQLMSEVFDLTAEFGPIFPIVHPAQAIAWNATTTPYVTPSPIGLLVLAKDA